VAFLILRLQS